MPVEQLQSMARTLKGASFMYRSRGVRDGVVRVRHLVNRFGFGPAAQIRCLDHYLSVLEKHDVPATLFVPARVFALHRQALRRMQCHRVEIGVHALVHTDLSALPPARRAAQIRAASTLFRTLGVDAPGFRAPYLREGAGATDVLSKEGFAHDSSGSVLWDEVYPHAASSYEWAMRFYAPQLHSRVRALPSTTGRLVTIPTSLPDDDMLVDRDGLDRFQVHAIWERILDLAHASGELFVLQLHPERVIELGPALEELVARAKRQHPPMWITTLGEVAKRWATHAPACIPPSYRGALCITGDLDAVSLTDFADRLRCW